MLCVYIVLLYKYIHFRRPLVVDCYCAENWNRHQAFICWTHSSHCLGHDTGCALLLIFLIVVQNLFFFKLSHIYWVHRHFNAAACFPVFLYIHAFCYIIRWRSISIGDVFIHTTWQKIASEKCQRQKWFLFIPSLFIRINEYTSC